MSDHRSFLNDVLLKNDDSFIENESNTALYIQIVWVLPICIFISNYKPVYQICKSRDNATHRRDF